MVIGICQRETPVVASTKFNRDFVYFVYNNSPRTQQGRVL